MIIAHIFGFLGLFFIVAAWQFNSRKQILYLNVAAFVSFAVELYLLDAYVGSIMMAFAATNTLIAVFTQNRYVMVSLMIFPVLVALSKFGYWHDSLPIIAHITGSLAFFSKSVKDMRLLAPVGTILWAVYNVIVGAWGQFIADLFILSSMALGAFRHRNSLKTNNIM